MVIRGSMPAEDVQRLSDAMGEALAGGPAVVLVCDMSPATEPDMTVVDALARLALTAKRYGRPVVVRRACPELLELLALSGLTAVPGIDLETGWESEEREPPSGVQEERDPGDPVA